jgi:IMP cyclohydrolase
MQNCRVFVQFCRIPFFIPAYFCREKHQHKKSMTSLSIFLIIGTLVAAVTIVTIQQARYRRIIKKKNEGIIKQIYEQNQLQEKMETTEVEKQVIEKMLQKKFEAVVFMQKAEGKEKKR